MNAPAPKPTTAPDEALSSLIGAALDVPAAPEQPEVPAWAPDNTLARTGNTEKEQAMWFGGMEQAQANAQDNAAIRGGADWLPIESAPQTGRTLLLGYWNSLGKWRTVRGQWMSLDHIAENWEEPDDAEAGWFETAVEAEEAPNCWRITPSHWQPLPAAPGTPAFPVSTVEQGDAQKTNFRSADAVIDDYIDEYELRGEDDEGRDGVYSPTESERYMIKDAIYGLLAEPEFIAALSRAPAAGDARDAARYRWLRNEVLVDGEVNDSLYVHVDSPEWPTRWALVGDELDTALDAAIAAQRQGDA